MLDSARVLPVIKRDRGKQVDQQQAEHRFAANPRPCLPLARASLTREVEQGELQEFHALDTQKRSVEYVRPTPRDPATTL